MWMNDHMDPRALHRLECVEIVNMMFLVVRKVAMIRVLEVGYVDG
jgi:hypothetical protein